LHILLALDGGERHGYDILQVKEDSQDAAKVGHRSLDRYDRGHLVINSNTRDPRRICCKLIGTITGVANAYDSADGKCLQLLKEAAPQVERVRVIQNSPSGTIRSYFPQWSSRPRTFWA
jgi:hypothetical protein